LSEYHAIQVLEQQQQQLQEQWQHYQAQNPTANNSLSDVPNQVAYETPFSVPPPVFPQHPPPPPPPTPPQPIEDDSEEDDELF
jgi:hypothetical protein